MRSAAAAALYAADGGRRGARLGRRASHSAGCSLTLRRCLC